MNYLMVGGDTLKYDAIKSRLIWGHHSEQAVKFSVIIPTYKRIGSLDEAIRSAQNQRYSGAYEIVIVDNNDSDEEIFQQVRNLISSYHDERIVYYRNESNIGIYGNTLRAGQLAYGERLVLLNDDDLLHPMYLQVINSFLEKFRYEGVIGTIPAEFRDNDFEFVKCHGPIRSYPISKVEFFFGCTVTSPGLCVPKKIYSEVYNAYDGLLMGDQILQYKALKKYGLIFVDYPLALYRIEDNATKKGDVLLDMVVHMCRFRTQTAKDSLFLRAYLAVFGKCYYSWYINETSSFWKNRNIKAKTLHELNVEEVTRNSFGYQLNAWFISKIHKFYSRYRSTHCDVIKKGLDY